MAIYKVEYHSMTASYGPRYIPASSEDEAKRKFAGGAFTAGEMALISAREVSPQEVVHALYVVDES